MRNLKIAFVVPSFPVTSETFIINQICDLINRGHSVTIFCFQKNETGLVHPLISDYGLQDLIIYREDQLKSVSSRYLDLFRFLISNWRLTQFKKLISVFKFQGSLRKSLNLRNFTKYFWILQQGPFDIYHAHFGHVGLYMAEMKSFGYFKEARLVTSFHGYDIRPSLIKEYKKIYHTLFEQGDVFIVNSPYSEGIVQSISKTALTKVLPVGLFTNMFQKKKCKTSVFPFTIIYVGRLIPIKGPHVAIDIIKRYLERYNGNLRLIIIGEGPMEVELQEEVKAQGLEKNIFFLGARTQNEVKKYMEDSDIFILPGIYDLDGRAETQGLVIQEAQAMELPVLVSDVGGMKYGLIDGETGFVVKEKDIESFVEKIHFFVNNRDVKTEMGNKGRRFVVDHFDSEVLGLKLESLYLQLSS